MDLVYESGMGKWSTQQYRVNERFDAWQAMLNESHLSWSLEKRQPQGFFGKLEVTPLGNLKVVRCICEPCSGDRRPIEIGNDNTAFYGLLLIISGHEDVVSRGKSAILGPGSFYIWDSTERTSFYLHSNIHKVTLFVPQDRLRSALPNVDNLVGVAIDWQNGLGAVTGSLLSNLSSHIGYMNARQGYILAENTIDLISSCLWDKHSQLNDKPGMDLLARIKDYIEINLEDADLDPPALACRFGISVRYLHLLFEEECFSVSRWIMERRLERCRRELSKVNQNKSITEIAFCWGFTDSAHFSRSFKHRYGISPKTFRGQIIKN